jgi:hypothetical protein
MDRRTLLKVAAAGAIGWVAPEIFTTSAEAQTIHSCCACYQGDPVVHGQPTPGPFIAAAVGSYTDQECANFCAGAAPSGEHGVVLHFTSNAHSFIAVGAASPQPGCHYRTHWLDRVIVPPGPPDGPGYHSKCPPKSETQPLGVHCGRAYWKS